MDQTAKFHKILKPAGAVFFLFSFLLAACKGPSSVDTHPVIWVNSYSFSFSSSEFGPNAPAQVLQVKNSGIETLSYDITDDAAWLSISPANGSSSGQAQQHSIVIDKAGLSGREEPYTAKIKIASQNACNSPQEVVVSLKVTKEPPPEISVNPKDLTFNASTSGPNPASQNVVVRNSGKQTLNYNITSDSAWLSVNPASGSSTGQEITHSVSVNVAGLAKGTYTGELTVSDPNAVNSPQAVTVQLTVSDEPPPQIALTPNDLSFSAQIGGADPGGKALKVRNSGKRTLNYVVTDDAAWLSVSPASGSSTGQEITHVVSASIAGLAKGTYQATITVTDPGAVNSPQSVRVSLDVTDIPPPPTSNEIAISCDPGSGGTGAIVTATIWISGNTTPIDSFGLELSFTSEMFEYLDTSRGSLTGGFAFVAGNLVRTGVVRIGGVGGASVLSVGSSGSIAVVRFRVTGTGLPSGSQGQLSIGSFVDDIVGMKTSPATATFTLIK